MFSHRSLIATIAVCSAIAGSSFAQTTPPTPSNPHPVQNVVPPAAPRPTELPIHSPTLPATPSTVGVPPQQSELQRQQQELRNGVQSTTNRGMHPRAGETHNGTDSPNSPASASSIH